MDDTTPQGAPKVAHLRLPAELHAQLVEFAGRTHRSLNGAAIYLLERGLRPDTRPPSFSPDEYHTR
ncbi:MAG: hypothetical protein L0I24_00275 [Pseudonocardia sp.]|nr:hypothetical protein [Pseudonocardia sp.]